MITDAEKEIIKDISKKYYIKRVLLFGSCLLLDRENVDIDIAVKGISPHDFYKFYGDLLFALPKSVDVIDLSRTSKFIQIIQQEGVPLYG